MWSADHHHEEPVWVHQVLSAARGALLPLLCPSGRARRVCCRAGCGVQRHPRAQGRAPKCHRVRFLPSHLLLCCVNNAYGTLLLLPLTLFSCVIGCSSHGLLAILHKMVLYFQLVLQAQMLLKLSTHDSAAVPGLDVLRCAGSSFNARKRLSFHGWHQHSLEVFIRILAFRPNLDHCTTCNPYTLAHAVPHIWLSGRLIPGGTYTDCACTGKWGMHTSDSCVRHPKLPCT